MFAASSLRRRLYWSAMLEIPTEPFEKIGVARALFHGRFVLSNPTPRTSSASARTMAPA